MQKQANDVDTIDKAIRVFIADRIKRMGETDSGALGYYAERVKTVGLSSYERALLQELAGETRVYHIGIGFGTLAVALAAEGKSVVGFESFKPRYDGAVALRDKLVPNSDYDIRYTRYPDGMEVGDTTGDAVLLFTNFVGTIDPEKFSEILDGMANFKRTILDLRLFGVVRDLPEERAKLQKEIEHRGASVKPLQINTPGAFYVEIRPLKKAASAKPKSGQKKRR